MERGKSDEVWGRLALALTKLRREDLREVKRPMRGWSKLEEVINLITR